jgi:hypothetical protein
MPRMGCAKPYRRSGSPCANSLLDRQCLNLEADRAVGFVRRGAVDDHVRDDLPWNGEFDVRRVTVQSDNPAYPDWPHCDIDDLNCIGRVIWAGRRIS